MRNMHNTYGKYGDEALLATIAGVMSKEKRVKIITPETSHSQANFKPLVNRLEEWRKQQEDKRKEDFVPAARVVRSVRRKVHLADVC